MGWLFPHYLLAKHIPKIQPSFLFQGKNKISTRYEWLNLLLKVSCIFLMVLVFVGYFFALSRNSNLDTKAVKFEIKCASNTSIFGKFFSLCANRSYIGLYNSHTCLSFLRTSYWKFIIIQEMAILQKASIATFRLHKQSV